MNIVTFNTGRQYTAEGQVISYTMDEKGLVLFADHSRMIYGEFTLDEYGQQVWETYTPFLKAEALMSNYYDKCNYQMSVAAMMLKRHEQIAHYRL